MNALRRAWETEHGKGSVVGLAPSAVAAQVLAEDLGIPTENTAKWWHTHLTTGTTFQAGQLVIVDEASLAGTLSLDRISALAAEADAKVLLVGDYAQLQSVDAGGAFGLLVHDRDDTPELVDIHRFVNDWEKTASLNLRHGHTDVIDTYAAHDRIRGGEAEQMIDAAYTAWRTDMLAGRVSVLIADSNEHVTALNTRARADLILDGTLDARREIELHDGTAASIGDTVITRRNDRRLRTGRNWVRNGDRWTITSIRTDGSLNIRPAGKRWGGTIVLPADYATEHLDLGYAVTSHRAQGLTTDTAHVLVDTTTTRENLYVALTRGRETNTAYVATDRPDDSHAGPHPGDNPDATARSILYGVLQHVGAELSAHETITAEHEQWGSIAQLAAEYETIAQAAQHDRWAALLHASGLTDEQVDDVLVADTFGALSAELRRAEANHHNVDLLLPRLVNARGLGDADDIAAVLHERLARATVHPAGQGRARKTPRLIAGLIPEASGTMTPDMQQSLFERHELIEERAAAQLQAAVTTDEPWTAALGSEPTEPRAAARWRQHARTVAAYRDRYGITTLTVLGPAPDGTAQKIDAARARAALDQARNLAERQMHEPARHTGQTRVGPVL
ncbi:transfer protein homolog TraA [Microbacterium esteraromaticum]|uniref:Transfer protein homolog TraA n=1 Tax=Microbacterium esteraromaticum TaxID=57043 RepID=A0A1R4I786_9MICO|nr:transfer protein homolog TraA [Microbacterium esteraromaticum]